MKQSEPHYNIYIITGKVHSGKTTFLSGLTDRLKQERVSLAGFLSMGSFNGDQRSTFTLVNIEDGKQHKLASIVKREAWIRFGRFYFNPEALLEGERIISRGLEQRADLVVLDEVGPFELEGGGWTSVLNLLEKEYELIQIWVVREQALAGVLERWDIPPENVFRVDPRDEETIIKTILSHARNDEISPAT